MSLRRPSHCLLPAAIAHLAHARPRPPLVRSTVFYAFFLSRPPCGICFKSCPFSPAATSCNHGDSDPHLCPLSTCPSAPWPDLVPSLLVGPPDHAQRVGAIPVDAVSTWLDHLPRCPEEPIDWWHRHRLGLWASEYVGSGSRLVYQLGPARNLERRMPIPSCWIDILTASSGVGGAPLRRRRHR